jgi:hypothetical protein
MTAILNGGMLSLSKTSYLVIELAIVSIIIWFGPAGLVIHNNGFHWVNACMLYIFAGFFGIHGWPFRPAITWALFFVILAINRSLMEIDIFDKIPLRWHWAVVTFRLHILHRQNTYVYSPSGFVGYVCPNNYAWGVVALHAFRTFSVPSGTSKIICFLATKIFMIHLLDCLVWIYGNPLQNLVRPGERVTPPWNGNLNAGLVTVQALSYGTLSEIYRDRVFIRFFGALKWLLNWAISLFFQFYIMFWRTETTAQDSAKKKTASWISALRELSVKRPPQILRYAPLNHSLPKAERFYTP